MHSRPYNKLTHIVTKTPSMADACFIAPATTRKHVQDSIGKLVLPKNASGQYNHEDITTFFNAVARILKSKFNPANPGNSMAQLLVSHTAMPPSLLYTVKLMDVATVASVFSASGAAVQATSTATVTVLPSITTHADAQDLADCNNQTNQAIIGSKEGATKAIVLQVGSDITHAVVRSTHNTNLKSIDDYEPHMLVNAAIQGANRLDTADILGLLTTILAFKFDFQCKVSSNMEILQAKIARIHSYGITIDDTQLAITLLTDIKLAANKDYGCEFRPAIQAI